MVIQSLRRKHLFQQSLLLLNLHRKGSLSIHHHPPPLSPPPLPPPLPPWRVVRHAFLRLLHHPLLFHPPPKGSLTIHLRPPPSAAIAAGEDGLASTVSVTSPSPAFSPFSKRVSEKSPFATVAAATNADAAEAPPLTFSRFTKMQHPNNNKTLRRTLSENSKNSSNSVKSTLRRSITDPTAADIILTPAPASATPALTSETRHEETTRSKKIVGDDPKRTKIQISQVPSMEDSVPTLLPEVISEIFARLPVKSLLQFRCVSKYWLAEISSPRFIKKHLSLAVNNKEDTHHMLMYNPDYELPLRSCTLRSMFCQNVTEGFDLDYPISDYKDGGCPRSNWILGSANGLIWFAAGENDLFIGNPSIRKYRKLPYPRPGLMKSVQFPRYNFGYDEFHDDYKVVALFASPNSDQDEVEIYSLKGDSWRSIDHSPNRTLDYPGTCLNGKFHWVDDIHHGEDIYSFDLADEKWRKLKQPFYGEEEYTLCLTVLASDLSIICDYVGSRLDIWIMKEYGVKESWTMMSTIKCSSIALMIFHLDYQLSFLSKKGEILLVFGSRGMIYNPKDKLIRYSKVTKFDRYPEAAIYVESLVSPFLTEECEDAR